MQGAGDLYICLFNCLQLSTFKRACSFPNPQTLAKEVGISTKMHRPIALAVTLTVTVVLSIKTTDGHLTRSVDSQRIDSRDIVSKVRPTPFS
jgi:hypothetical protein